MQGRVYYFARPGQHDDFGHPNCIVVQYAGDAYLCVAGFTPEKQKYEEMRQAEHAQGIWGNAFAVEIDHKKHLTPVKTNLELHVCGYVCQTAEAMTGAQLAGAREWGPLSSQAVREIAEGLLAREAEKRYLPKKAIAALKKLLVAR